MVVDATAVVVAIITAIVGPIAVVVVGVLVKKLADSVRVVAAKTERVRAQVENSHQTNLREESDERHTKQMILLNNIATQQADMRRDIGGLRQDVRGLREVDNLLARQQADDRARIGDTLTPEEKAEVRVILAERRNK